MSSDSSHSIVAPLCYMSENPKYEREIPYFLLEVEPTLEVPSTNIEHVTYDVVIENMRNKSETLSIDANGFKLVDWPSKISMDSDYEEVKNYCREMASLVAKELHAEEVLVFDFRFRSNEPSFETLPSNLVTPEQQYSPVQTFAARPVHKAHIDQTEEGGIRRLRMHLTREEFSKYVNANYRIRIVNIWRTFNTTAQDMPLALCWPNTVGDNDPVIVEVVEPNMVGENYYLRYNKNQKWFWARDMMPNEALIFSTWDSKRTEQTTNCAYHTAFPNPLEPTTPRLSLEVRTVVINAIGKM